MFRIKICGVRCPDDARVASNAGADAIGLNFYIPSPRCATLGEAQTIASTVPDGVLLVGVFVNPSVAEVLSLTEQVPLGAVQLHGDEPPEFLADLPQSLRVARALRIGDDGLAPVADYLSRCASLGRSPDALLLDAASGKAYGGTGQRIDWPRVHRERGSLGDLPLLLAGGLTPENVERAIAEARPDGVDTASGVESSPGEKDPEAIRRFIEAARRGLGSHEP